MFYIALPSILPILSFLAVFALVIFGLWYRSPAQKGKRGEKSVANILETLPEGYYILNDVVLQTKNGTTQIDHIVVSKFGVFVIETKNYRGKIYGRDSLNEWTQIIVTKVRYKRNPFKVYTYVTKNNLYNPVKQSLGHVYCLKDMLKEYEHLPIVPIVVFVGTADLGDIETKRKVIYQSELLSVIKNYTTTYLTYDDVQDVLSSIQNGNMRETVNNRQHIMNIKRAKDEVEGKIASRICPKCGGNLVERSGKYGKFFGCSNYPNCTYTYKCK